MPLAKVSGSVWDVRDGVADVPDLIVTIHDEILDVRSLVLNVPDETLDIREGVTHVQNLTCELRNAVWNVEEGVTDIHRQHCDNENVLLEGGNLMGYKRRASQVVADAQERATNLKAIDPDLDLGSGLTVAAFEGEIVTVQAALEAYNKLLAQADAAANDLNGLEKNLGTLSGRMLAGVGVRFGKDSNEYEMAGGVRTSEIKRGGKKEKPEKDRA